MASVWVRGFAGLSALTVGGAAARWTTVPSNGAEISALCAIGREPSSVAVSALGSARSTILFTGKEFSGDDVSTTGGERLSPATGSASTAGTSAAGDAGAAEITGGPGAVTGWSAVPVIPAWSVSRTGGAGSGKGTNVFRRATGFTTSGLTGDDVPSTLLDTGNVGAAPGRSTPAKASSPVLRAGKEAFTGDCGAAGVTAGAS